MFCNSTTLTTHHADRVTAHRLSCRTWACEECRPMRLRQLRDLAASGNPVTMITLTVAADAYDDPNEAARALVHAWRMIVQRAKRNGFSDKISYLAVFEETQRGLPHLHILARCSFIPQAWLSERMREHCRSPVCWINAIKSRRIASRYVAKYVSKGPGRYEGCKRYWRSQDYQQQPTGWEKETPVHDAARLYHPQLAEAIAQTFERAGWSVKWSSWHRFEARPLDPDQPEPWFDAWIHTATGPPGRAAGSENA